MKTIKQLITLTLLITGLTLQGQQAMAQKNGNAVDNAAALPTGTYFIINAKSQEALTPNEATPGQNVFLNKFKKSGMQKWSVKQIKTKKGISYTIALSGSDALWLSPFPGGDHTPIVNSTGGAEASYSILPAAASKSWYIKSNHLRGDAMQSFVYSKETPTELRFNPADANDKFYWLFIPAGD